MVKENATSRVLPKEDLSVFKDPCWFGVPYDQNELENALQETGVIVELKDLENISWIHLTHAYGEAGDVPRNLKRLASLDANVRDEALFNLGMTILHQGSLYSATTAAIPFLLQLVSVYQLPNRSQIMEFIYQIFKECRVESWKKRKR